MIKKSLVVLLTSSVISAAIIYFAYGPPTRSHGPSTVNLLVISDEIKEDIKSATTRRDDILAIQIVTIHFQRNVKLETFISINNDTLQQIYNSYIHNKVLETPFFSSDPVNNKRMLGLINGNFVCVPFDGSTRGQITPESIAVVKTICSIGIPPQTLGEFTGILTIYLGDIPSEDTINYLRLFARDISDRIYNANKSSSIYRNITNNNR